MAHFTIKEVYKDFDSQSKSKQINILLQALDYMQQSNTRTKATCIALALGYKNPIGEFDTFEK